MSRIVDDISRLMLSCIDSPSNFMRYASVVTEFLNNQAQIEAYSSHMRIASETRPHFWRDGLGVWVKVAESAAQEFKEGVKGTTKARNKTRQTAEQRALARKTKDKKGRKKITKLIAEWQAGTGNAKNIALKRLKGMIIGPEYKAKKKSLRMEYNKLRNEGKFKSEKGNDVKFNSLPTEKQNEITYKEYIQPLAQMAMKSIREREQAKEDEEVARDEGRSPEKAPPKKVKEEGDDAAPTPSLKKEKKTDQDKIKEFLDNASEETRKSLEKLSPQDQMKAIKAIVSTKGEDEGLADTFTARAARLRHNLNRY